MKRGDERKTRRHLSRGDKVRGDKMWRGGETGDKLRHEKRR